MHQRSTINPATIQAKHPNAQAPVFQRNEIINGEPNAVNANTSAPR